MWVVLAFGAGKALGLASSLVLARFLAPADFGLVAFAMIAIGAFTLLQNLGVPAAIVQGDRDVREVGGTALTINLAAALALFGVTLTLAPLLARAGGHAEIAPVMAALGLGLVISALGSVHSAVLIKRLAFRRKFLPDVLPLLASGVISVGMAVAGFGVWSLVAGNLAKAVTSTALLWALSSIRPWPRFKRSVAAELLRYGQHVSLTGLIGFASANADYFVVGVALGASDLGIYTLAFMLANVPATVMTQAVANVTFSAFSRLRSNHEQLLEVFGDAFTVTSTLAGLAGIVTFAAAPSYVPLLLGERWIATAVPLQLLVVYGVMRAVHSNFGSIFRAIGRPDVEWQLSLGRLVVLLPVLALSARAGVPAVAAAQSIVMLCFVPLNAAVLLRLMAAPAARVRAMALPPTAGALAAAGVLAAPFGVPALREGTAGLAGSAALAAAAGTVYLGTILGASPRARTLVRQTVALVS